MKSTSLVFAVAALAVACSKSPEPKSLSPAASASAAPKAASVEPAPAAAKTPFEGEITVSVKGEPSKKLPASVTYDVKGNRVRYVPSAAPVHVIGDLDVQRVYAIDDAQKRYESIDMKTPSAKPTPPPKVQKTSKTENIAGLECENWTIDNGNEKVDVCASKGIAYLDLASDAKAGSVEPPWAEALSMEKAFPLRVVVHDKSGKEAYRAEATAAVWKKIDDAVFRLPIDYMKADLARETKTASLP